MNSKLTHFKANLKEGFETAIYGKIAICGAG
jgi:hypothetical protein